jgi:hypothetical protein
MDGRDERKRTSAEASKIGAFPWFRDQHGGNLLTGYVVSGVQEA